MFIIVHSEKVRHTLKHTPPANSRRLGAVSLALTLTATPALSTPTAGYLPLPFTTGLPSAQASPNDTLALISKGHVDSPKTTWNPTTKNFHLIAHAGQDIPVEQSVSWLSPTYGSKGQQRYIYTVDGAEPQLAFLGEPGTDLYWAKATPEDMHNMLWQGFGASTDIPTNTFRDGAFQLDLVDMRGPGKMNLFAGGEGFPINRLLSSHDGPRSTWLTAGQHSHNDTTFSKPGRYELTLRASARGKDGTLISSSPQTLVWQVGGSQPSSSGIGDIRTAFNVAPASGAPASPKLSLSPFSSSDATVTPAGNDASKLSTMRFATGNEQDKGTAVFYIDGHFLAEVPVNKGTAQWSDMLGNGSSEYQVVFIPAKGSPSPRWVSEPLRYDRTQQAISTAKAGQFPQAHQQQPVQRLPEESFTPTSKGVSISTSSEETVDGFSTITVTPEDPSLTMKVIGGLYDSADAEYPACMVDFISAPGHRSGAIDSECGDDEYELRLQVIPDARSTVGAATVSQKVKAGDAYSLNTTTQLGGGSEATDDAPGDTPGAEDPSQPRPEEPGTGEDEPGSDESGVHLATSPVRLSTGHVDIAPMETDKGLAIGIGDDTRQVTTQGSTRRAPSSVTLEVSELARHVRGEKNFAIGEDFDFLGASGEDFWYLPQANDRRLIWPGFSTEHTSRERYPHGFDFEVAPESAPAGAQWWAFTSALGGVGDVLATSEETHTIRDVSHLHLNWVFTHPGAYSLKVRAIPRQADGTADATRATGWESIHFDVKGSKNNDIPGDDQPSTPTPTPAPDHHSGSSLGADGTIAVAIAGALGIAGIIGLLTAMKFGFLRF